MQHVTSVMLYKRANEVKVMILLYRPSSCGNSWQNTAIDVLNPPGKLLANAEPKHTNHTHAGAVVELLHDRLLLICGGNFSDNFIRNLLSSPRQKKNLKICQQFTQQE